MVKFLREVQSRAAHKETILSFFLSTLLVSQVKVYIKFNNRNKGKDQMGLREREKNPMKKTKI